MNCQVVSTKMCKSEAILVSENSFRFDEVSQLTPLNTFPKKLQEKARQVVSKGVIVALLPIYYTDRHEILKNWQLHPKTVRYFCCST